MFTFRPGRNANGGKNGHGGNGHGNNGHNGNGHHDGNGNGHQGRVESVIGPGIHWKGALAGTGGVRIEGSFDGPVKLNGALIVAEGARVTSDEIHASAVSVAGTIKGNIVADRVEILSTGRVYGDLMTRAFASEEGAFLRGQIVMQDEQAPLQVEPARSAEAAA